MYDPSEICAQRIVDTRLDLLVRDALPDPKTTKVRTGVRTDHADADEIVIYEVRYGFTYCTTGSRSKDLLRLIAELVYGGWVDVDSGLSAHTRLTMVYLTVSGLGSVWNEVTDHFRLAMFHTRANKWRHMGP